MSTTLFLVDGYGLIFRSYYAHIKSPLRNSKGDNTSAIYGFFQSIQKIFNDYEPSDIVIALDSSDTKLARKKLYPAYKANRQKTPDDLKTQIGIIIDIIKAMEIPHLSVVEHEADDIIATLAKKNSNNNLFSTIISSDKDLFQLLGNYVSILRPTSKSNDWIPITPTWINENYHIEYSQIHDYLAIIGDSSDNIPGVAGLGPKTAVSLLQNYKNLDEIFDNIANLKESWRKKLVNSEEIARLSYKLIELNDNVEIPQNFTTNYPELLWHKARHFFEENDMHYFLKKSNNDTIVTQNKQSASTKNTLVTLNKTLPLSVSIIETPEQLQKVIDTALSQKRISIYPEYTGHAINATLTGLSLACYENQAYYIPFPPLNEKKDTNSYSPSMMENSNTRKKYINLLQLLFKNKECVLIFHDAKQALNVLHNEGFEKEHNHFHQNKHSIAIVDCIIAAWLIIPDSHNYDIVSLCNKYLPEHPLSQSINAFHTHITNSDTVDTVTYINVAALHSAVLLAIWDTLAVQLKQNDIYEEYISTETYLCYILSKIEQSGISINSAYLKELSSEFAHTLTILEKEIHSISGEGFNINSPKQIQKILYEKLALPKTKKTKTGYSTDVNVLEYLSTIHPLPKKILEFRHISKLKNTYSDTLPKQVNKNTQRIHTTLHQNGSETGRLSSTNPNLQNIPIKDFIGQQLRHAFITKKGYKLISADYSQIELVVLAHLSKDTNLLDAFVKKVDIHTRTASILFHTNENNIDETQRRIAKSINFGVIYGMSAFRLANELKISQQLAKEFITSYFNEFSSITKYIHTTVTTAEKQGYTTTILGRRRYYENINSKNKNLKHAAERMAVNSTIQGSAADIMKLSMIKVNDALQKQSLSSKIILQIHDELLLECPEKEITTVFDLLYEIMPNAYTSLSVPLSISVKAGNSWGEIK